VGWWGPEIDVGDAAGDAVDVDVLGVAGCLGDDHDVVLFRRTLVDVSQPDHRPGGGRTQETALATTGFDHRQSSGGGTFLGVGGFEHQPRIREVGERCLGAPVDCLRAATVVGQ